MSDRRQLCVKTSTLARFRAYRYKAGAKDGKPLTHDEAINQLLDTATKAGKARKRK